MLQPNDRQVLADLKAVVDSLKLPMLVVGAGAKLIIFDRKHNIQGRSTNDWEVAIPVASWADFQRLRECMIQGLPPRFEITNVTHKFIHVETRIEVDIVPFGAIGEPDQQIEWADGNQMNVMGFAEALMHASVEKIDDLELQIVDLPAFIVLKLFAWNDRKGRTNKDLTDINFILEHYNDDERVYKELFQELGEEQIKYQDAAIYLLGQDIRKIFRDETIIQINVILEQLTDDPDDDASDFVKRLKVLQTGIKRSLV